jgi:hypothetical protein
VANGDPPVAKKQKPSVTSDADDFNRDEDSVFDEGNREEPSEDDKFMEERRSLAQSQNLSGDNAVGEVRPIASQHPNPANERSELTKRLEEEGEINTKPMSKEAFDRAASDAQKDKAEEASQYEALKAGDVARVTEGPHRDRVVAITRVVSYQNTEDLAVQQSGRPEANYVQPEEIEGRARGDERDGEILILNVKDAGLKKVPNYMGTGRG